jgi:large subunit ribosomal protein L14
MIQIGTFLSIIDNSGAKQIQCIKTLGGYNQRYARIGMSILSSIKQLRSTRKITTKVKKGSVQLALIIRTKSTKSSFTGDLVSFSENSAILLTKQNRPIGTRIFGSVPKFFRYTKHLKLISLSNGITL